MIKIMFVCLGNICRSPLAEFLMKYKTEKLGLSFEINSKATSYEEEGNPVYYMAAKILDRFDIDYSKKRAERLTRKDGDYYDYIIGMEERNCRAIKNIIGSENHYKVYRLLDFTDLKKDIADPWYTRDFETTLNEICLGLDGLIRYLQQERGEL